MLIIKSMKARMYPTTEQAEKTNETINYCRYIKNHMIERNSIIYKRRNEHLSRFDMINILPKMKVYLPWLKEVDSKALQASCSDVDTAFQKFFRKEAGYPKFHSKKNQVQSYTTTSGSVKWKKGFVYLPIIKWVKISDKRVLPIDAKICSATVKRDHGRYYVSITYKVEVDVVPYSVDPDNVIGLDYKSNGLYVSSNGDCCNMPHFYRETEPFISKELRKLSSKQGFRKGEAQSNNFKKQLRRLYKKTSHIANQRKGFLHEQSASIAKKYDAVCVESLNMKDMSNKGFGNGKATMDNGYGMFLRFLEYKLLYLGKQLIHVDKWYPSSQVCHCCGYKNPDVKSLSIRKWACPQCGAAHDRDINAAINIKNEGLRMMGLVQVV